MNQRPEATTDEMLARRRESRIGQVWTPREPFFNTQATRDNIKRFVNGIGDRNPLYRDREYAQKSRYGRLAAPPCFLYSVFHPGGGGGGPRRETRGGGGGLGGGDWEWLAPILEGDEFTYTSTYLGEEGRKSRDSRELVMGSGVAEYKNQRGQVVARATAWTVGVVRGGEATERETRAREAREKAKYTPEELQKIYDDYDKEVIRGATPRYWEDVQIGEELPPIVKGPLSLLDVITFVMGAGTPYIKAHGLYRDYLHRHPRLERVNPTTGELQNPELWHFVDSVAQGGVLVVPWITVFNGYVGWVTSSLTGWGTKVLSKGCVVSFGAIIIMGILLGARER